MRLCLICSGPKGNQVTRNMAKFANAVLRNCTANKYYTYYQGDHANEVEIDRNLANMGKMRNQYGGFVGQPEGNRKHTRELNDNIKKESKG